MKKMMIALMAVLITVALAGIGTWAYFSDTEKATGNTFTAGTIDISLNPSAGQQVQTVSGGFELLPGETGWTTAVVKNAGNKPAMLWKRITGVTNNENTVTDAEGKYYAANPGSNLWNISDWIHYDMLVTKPPATSYSYSGTIDGVGVKVDDLGDRLKWTYTYSDPPISTPKMTVSINYPSGYAITTFDDGSHTGWYYAPDGGPEVQFATDIFTGGSYLDFSAGSTSPNVLWVEIKKSSLGDAFHWHGYANLDGIGVWINGTESGTGYGTPPFEVTLGTTVLEIKETDGFYLTDNGKGIEGNWIRIGLLQPGESVTVKQSYHLDKTVDNWAQSDIASFDVNFMALQVGADDPTPVLLLP